MDNINLLIIDNQQDYFNAICDYIEICNYKDKISATFENEVNVAKDDIVKSSNSIVILDAYLENENSLELLEYINSKHLTSVLVSDNPSNDLKSLALKKGAIAYFNKKYTLEDLDPLFELILKNAKTTNDCIN